MPGITINETGVCNECTRHNKHPGYNLDRLKLEMEEKLARVKQENRTYDALVCFSGGKDSAYLLHMLKEQYGLRPVAFAVLHPFVKDVASSNMDRIAQKLHVDLIKFYPDEEMFAKFLRYGLLHGHKYGLREFAGCSLCGYIYHWVSYRMAMKMKIPLVLDGRDPSQVEKPHLIDGLSIKAAMESGVQYHGTLPDIFDAACGDEYRGSIYDFSWEEMRDAEFPTAMSPFTFLEYDYLKNCDTLIKAGVVEQQEIQSAVTNCDAHHFFAYLAYKHYDCHPYERHFAAGIRKGYATNVDQFGGSSARQLTREEILKILKEYKQGLFFLAERKERKMSQDEIVGLSKMLPTIASQWPGDGFSDWVEQMLTIHEYADYFGISLQEQ
jgi:hypothetical protein